MFLFCQPVLGALRYHAITMGHVMKDMLAPENADAVPNSMERLVSYACQGDMDRTVDVGLFFHFYLHKMLDLWSDRTHIYYLHCSGPSRYLYNDCENVPFLLVKEWSVCIFYVRTAMINSQICTQAATILQSVLTSSCHRKLYSGLAYPAEYKRMAAGQPVCMQHKSRVLLYPDAVVVY